MIGGAVRRQGDDDISFDRSVEGKPAGHPLAEHLVEKIRLIGVDEHHLEVRRQCRDRSLPVLASRQCLGHDLLEGHALGHDRSRVRPVRAVLQGVPELLQCRVLLRSGVRYVGANRSLDVTAGEPLADEMGDRSDRSESLDPEVVGESLVPGYGPDIAFDRVLDEAAVHGAVPDGDLERVPDQVPELYGPAPGVDVGYRDVLELHLRKILRRTPERHQLGGDRALVLGSGESYPRAGHAQASGHDPDEAVRLPVARSDRRDGVFAVLLRSGGIGYLPYDEVLWLGLEVSAGAVGIAEVSAHPHVRLGGAAFPVQGDHSLVAE